MLAHLTNNFKKILFLVIFFVLLLSFFSIFKTRVLADFGCNAGYTCTKTGNFGPCGSSGPVGGCGWEWSSQYADGKCMDNATGLIQDPNNPTCQISQSCCAAPPANLWPDGSWSDCACQTTCTQGCGEGWTYAACDTSAGQQCSGISTSTCGNGQPAQYCQTANYYFCSLSYRNPDGSVNPQCMAGFSYAAVCGADPNCTGPYNTSQDCSAACVPPPPTVTFTPTPVQSSCTPGQCTLAGVGTGCVKCYDAGGGVGQWGGADWNCPNYSWQECLCNSNPSDPSCVGGGTPTPTGGGCRTSPDCSQISAHVVDNSGNQVGPSVSFVPAASNNLPVLNITSGDMVKIDASNSEGDSTGGNTWACPYHTWEFWRDGTVIATEANNSQANATVGNYCYDNPGAPGPNLGYAYNPGYVVNSMQGATPLGALRIFASPGQWGSAVGCLGGNATACNSDTWGRNDCSTWEPGAQCSPAGTGGVSGLNGVSGIGLPCTGKQGQPDTIDWSFEPNALSFPRKYYGDGRIVYKFDNFSGTSTIQVAGTNNDISCSIRVSGSQSIGGKVTDCSTGAPLSGVKVLAYDIVGGVDKSAIDTTDANGNFLINSIGSGDTYSVWPQCVSGYNGPAGSMISSYAAPTGYLCNSSYGPVAKYSPHAYFAGSLPTYPHVGNYYDLAVPFGMPSGGSTKFDFCYNPISKYPLNGTVFNDLDHNGIPSGTDCTGKGTPVLSGDGTGSQTPNASTGAFSFGSINAGSYTVTLTNIPSNCQLTTTNPVTVDLTNPTTVNFGLTPLYSISGNVFVDNDKNTLKNGSETNYTGGTSSFVPYNKDSATVLTTVNTANGAFNLQNIVSGNYKISYTTLPNSYSMTFPTNGPPPSLEVTVGKTNEGAYHCSAGTSNSATCDASGNISNANFGITNSNTWVQCGGGDCSNNNGYVSNIPINPQSNCSGGSYASVINGSSSTTPGMIYSGSADPNFGSGQASPNPYDWVVGNFTYPQIFQPVNATVIRSSYGYMNTTAVQSGITPTALDSGCNNSLGCSLSSLGHGLYSTTGVVYINASDLSCKNGDGTNGNCVILINGDLHIKGNITVPVGSTATFSVSGNIYVDNPISPNPQVTNIQGFYSTDGSFYTGGNNGDCTQSADSALTINGAVVVNAGLGGGTFQNQRDLCGGNLTCPAVDVKERPDIILNAPDFIKHPTYIWHEAAP